MTISTIHRSGAAFRAVEMFADAITTTPEWEEWESARAAVRADAELQQLATRHRELVEQARGRVVVGAAAPGVEAELERLRLQLQRHPAAVRQQAAVLGLVELFRTLSSTLTEALGVDFVQLAAPPRGSGCCG